LGEEVTAKRISALEERVAELERIVRKLGYKNPLDD